MRVSVVFFLFTYHPITRLSSKRFVEPPVHDIFTNIKYYTSYRKATTRCLILHQNWTVLKNEISNLYYAQVIPFFDILLSEVMKELKGSEPKHSASPGFRKLQKCENYLKIAKINSLKVGNLTCNNWNPFCFRLSSSTVFITALPFSRC